MKETFEDYLQRLKDRRTEDNYKYTDEDFEKYKELIEKYNEFKTFYINYLEKNWVIIKEKNEISLILDDATTRYENFIKNNPNIENRIAKHHIANHLGITPTQLSRIRKKLKK